MHSLAGNIPQRSIDHALALKSGQAYKSVALYLHGKVRFAAAVMACMAMMTIAVVDHLKARGNKSCGQQAGYFMGYRSGHVFPCSRLPAMGKGMSHDRFHGRHPARKHICDVPGCTEPGEFRAPGPRGASFDGPGDYRWFCLDHVRAFNAGYDFFAGMSPEEIFRAQSPIHGWERQTRAFSPTAGIDTAPRWADFSDPLEAISARARQRRPAERKDGKIVSPEERKALEVLGLALDASRHDLRARYSELVRRYHPDRNGGDRSLEWKLQEVVEAWQLLKKSAAFS